MIFVELLKQEDIDEVLVLEKTCFPDDPWNRASFENELTNPNAYFLVARDDEKGEVVGYGGVWAMYDVGDITNIAVRPDYRREGIGRKILNLLIDLCKEKGMTEITLEVRQSNLPAQRLYTSEGFEICGLRKRYYQNKEDAVIMTLRFNMTEEKRDADFSH